jgi:minor extracellular serine protease Vpr
MRPRFFSARASHFVTALALLLWFSGVNGTSSSAQQPEKRTVNDTRNLKRMTIPGTGDLQLVVELTDPSVLARMLGSASAKQAQNAGFGERRRRVDFGSSQALAHRAEIARGQEAMKRRILQIPGAQVLGTTGTLLNTVIVRVPVEQYAAIRSLEGVKKVYFSRPRRMTLDQAALIQNAQNLWAMAGGRSNAGQGVRIGIIDTGIDITNPMFSGAGMSAPPGFTPQTTGMSGILDAARMNNKVIVARSYVQFLSNAQTVQTAEDEVGHGTFVAGCAAGAAVSAPRAAISGMAPGAYLGNYKILGTPGVNDSTTSGAEIAAVDDAVSDGMDVINLSIGGLDYLPPKDNIEYASMAAALQAGVIITVSAGNEGPNTTSINSPGTLPGVITVGSVSNAREFRAAIHTSNSSQDTIGYFPSSDGIQVSVNIPLTRVVDVASLDGNGLGCSAFSSGSLSSSIAFVQRGTCTFAVKVGNAAQAGAIAVVVYNNVAGNPISMSGLSSTTLPAVMISLADGTVLKQYIDANPAQARVGIDSASNLQAIPTTAGIVSDFSSVGPGTDFSIKPDLVAVGENVYSAAEQTLTSGPLYNASGFTVSSGTSFSSPMVAGAAAGLLQLHPDLGSPAIKSLLTTTASRNLTVDGVSPPNVLQAGAGLLDMRSAAEATAVFSPTSLSFGPHSYTGTLSLSLPLTVQNISSSPDRFNFGIESIVPGPSISFSANSTGDVAAGASANVVISLQIDSPATGGFQGFVTVTSATTGFVYRIPYWAGLYVSDSARVLKVSQSAPTGGSFTDIGAAITAAQPGNVIEIDDDSTYSPGSNGLSVITNGEGLPLNGLTIRAAAGRNPVIAVPSSGTGFWIIGVQNVLLQGLDIQGGYTGVELWQPAASVPFSATVDKCTISGNVGGSLAAGIWIDGGGTVDITQSTITNSTGTGLAAGAFGTGTQLTVTGTTVQGNAYDGVDVFDADVHIANSTFSNNGGDGAYLENCTGTVIGNSFSGNYFVSSSYFGDGLGIANGNLTVKDNISQSNDGAGIALGPSAPGPTVQILGNQLRNNGDYGIWSSPATSVYADGNFIADNLGGVYLDSVPDALLTNNIIVRSTGTGSGDGVEVDGGTSARLVNDTIYGNSLSGVRQTNGTVSVANSILSSNSGGDTQGSVSLSFSLFGSAATNPQFVAPGQNDFSLAAGSPAIDVGSNTVADLPFLDYNGRLRVASATGLPGQGTVDVGAIERDSAYPLVYPLILNGSDTTIGGTFTTGVAFVNPTDTAANYYFTGYKVDGTDLPGTVNPFSKSLSPQGQLAILDWQMFGFDSTATARGGVLGDTDSPSEGFVFLADDGFSKFATGVNATSQQANDLVFMRHESGAGKATSYVIFNPGVNSANVTATSVDPGGASDNQQTVVIPAKGQSVVQFPNAASGYVRVRSDRPVSGIELVGNSQVMAALGAFPPSVHARLFFPHFAVGGGYSTKVGIVNAGDSTATLTLNAYTDSGALIGSISSVTLQAGQQLVDTITDLFGIAAGDSTQGGYLIAQSDQAGIMGFTDFSYSDGLRNSDATIPADPVPSRRLIFSHIAQGVPAGTGVPYQTGVALLNPFGTTVAYTISVYDGAGNLVAQADNTIAPHQKVAKILFYPGQGIGFFDGDLTLGNGHIEVTSDDGLMGLELFFTEDKSQLASVPAQTSE